MTATPALTTDLQRQVLLLEDDLRQRVGADPELEGRWKQEHQRALKRERTAASWVAWRDDRVTQAAVAWVLTTVFIRFCEDNALVAPVWITGPEHRRAERRAPLANAGMVPVPYAAPYWLESLAAAELPCPGQAGENSVTHGRCRSRRLLRTLRLELRLPPLTGRRCHAFRAWKGKLRTVKSSTVRGELVGMLEEALRLQERLVAEARDPAVSAAELIAQVSMLERLDDRRDKLLGALREEAKAGQRAVRSGPSVREVVLAALDEMRWPQNAGFVEEYLWATRQVQLDSRAVAPLRRDERRAWQRAPGARKAYVAPALDPDGTANPRWVTSTAWDLERRVVAPGQSAELFDLYKIFALAGRPGTNDEARPRKPVDTLLEEYAEELLEIEPPQVTASAEEAATWRAQVRRQANVRISEVRAQDELRRKEIAAELAGLPEGDRFWGRSS